MTTTIVCRRCGEETPKRGQRSLYCPDCSERRDLERKRLWAAAHPPSPEQRAKQVRQRNARLRALGAEMSKGASITWIADDDPSLLWVVRVALPFTYAISKNHSWSTTRRGHIFLRQESTDYRWQLTGAIQAALASQRVVEHKVWLDILVEKPDHKGDAVNVVDLVCDAVKDAIAVDDRWFCLRRLDWRIVKTEPRLIVGLGQEVEEDHQPCSTCGALLPLRPENFNRHRGTRLGYARVCIRCRKALRSAT